MKRTKRDTKMIAAAYVGSDRPALPETAHRAFVASGLSARKVTRVGIRFGSDYFYEKSLLAYIGITVFVIKKQCLQVFDERGRLICTAQPTIFA
jgi:hypothetical protein